MQPLPANGKRLRDSRTIWLNTIVLVASLLAAIATPDIVSARTVLLINGVVLPLANNLLRVLTGQPIAGFEWVADFKPKP